MAVRPNIHFGNEGDLIERLMNPHAGDRFSFMFGSALTMPVDNSRFGVPGSYAIVEMIRNSLNESERVQMDRELGISAMDRYQTAMRFFESVRGKEAVNDLVAAAVGRAFKWDDPPHALNALRPSRKELTKELIFAATEEAVESWVLSPAVECLGKLIMVCGHLFGKDLLTTNFDPLIGISIRRAGGNYFRVALAEDGNLSGIAGNVPRIVHLHGFYHGTDTLHTAIQLKRKRPHLRDSLKKLLGARVLIVVGYGGWDDIFMDALARTVREREIREVLWTFYSKDEEIICSNQSHVFQALAPAKGRNIQFFKGIDVNRFIPKLYGFCGYQQLLSRKMLEVYLRKHFGYEDDQSTKWEEIFAGQRSDWQQQVEDEFNLTPEIVKETKSIVGDWSREQWEEGLLDFSERLIRLRLGEWVVPPTGLPNIEDLAGA
jgi:hypothetical protein